jgi:hypothetical protein
MDILVAALLAIGSAVLADWLGVGTRLRTGVRHLINRLSERSVAKLTKRIDGLKRYRARLSSEKGLYLAILSNILVVLFLMCFAGMFSIGGHFMTQVGEKWLSARAYDYWTLVCLGLAALLAYYGLRAAILDDDNRHSSLIKQVDKDIGKLEMKLSTKKKGT